MSINLSRQQARRIAVRAQLLDDRPVGSLVELVDQLTLLQVDPTAAIAPNVDLVSWSRLGNDYDHSDLTFALETERSLVEYSSFVRPMADVGLLLATARSDPSQLHPSWVAWVEANAGFRADILARLAADGPLVSTEIDDTSQLPWQSSGWTDDKNVTRMLELLNRLGDVAISGRRGKFRSWDLAERVYPADLEVPPLEEAQQLLEEKRLHSLGIIRPAKGAAGRLGSPGEECTVDGTEGSWLVDPDALAALDDHDQFAGRVALLSPYDRLVYDRTRAEELFDFSYVLEMYKPAAKRRWGYFALPILYGDQLVGKLDAKADRRKKRLQVNAVHQDFSWPAEIGDAVEAEIEKLADWLGLEITRP